MCSPSGSVKQPALLGVHFAAPDRSAVDELCAKAKSYGVEMAGDPAPLSAGAGGGYGFRFSTPDGLPMSISSDLAQHPDIVLDRSRPTKISHVVLNSARTDDQVPFFADVLGFKLSDSTQLMEFLRCSADHHSMAIFRNNGPSLNHVAYELPNIDGLMRGAGRVKQSGFDIAWGVGRHGPGSNVFSYFIEPNGFVAEYTTELDQVDDATHVPQNPEAIGRRCADAGPLGNCRCAIEQDAGRHVGRALSRRRRDRRPALRGHHRPQARLICAGKLSASWLPACGYNDPGLPEGSRALCRTAWIMISLSATS